MDSNASSSPGSLRNPFLELGLPGAIIKKIVHVWRPKYFPTPNPWRDPRFLCSAASINTGTKSEKVQLGNSKIETGSPVLLYCFITSYSISPFSSVFHEGVFRSTAPAWLTWTINCIQTESTTLNQVSSFPCLLGDLLLQLMLTYCNTLPAQTAFQLSKGIKKSTDTRRSFWCSRQAGREV